MTETDEKTASQSRSRGSRQSGKKGESPSQAESGEQGFARTMGLPGAMSVGLAAMLGAAIFVLAGEAAERAGPGATLTFVIAGLIVLPIAMTVSELVTAIPCEGGSYTLISRTLGPLAATVVGPANWIGLTFATGFYLIGFGRYLAVWVPIPEWVTAVVAGGLLIFVNYRGTRLTGTVEKAMVGTWLLLLVTFATWGFFNTEPELHDPFLPGGWGTVIGTLGLIIVTFTGFEKISTLAEEIKEPGKNLPRAIIGSVIVSTVVSATILYVLTGLVPYENATGLTAPMAEGARQFAGRLGSTVMVVGALLATASAANAGLLASSRINYAMGRDKILPGWFAEIHAEHMTPQRAVIVTGLLAVGLALSGQAPTLAEISSALFMISYALLVTAVVAMRHFSPDWYRPDYRVPLHPWLPLLGGIASLAVILTMDSLSQIAGLGLAVGSVIWYYAWAKDRTTVEGELSRHLGKEEAVEKLKAIAEPAASGVEAEKQQILVAVAEAEAGARLAKLAGHLATGHGKMSVLGAQIVKVPYNVSLRDAAEELSGEKEWQSMVRASVPASIEVETLHWVARSVAGGIVHLAEQRPPVSLILLGLEGPVSPSWPGSRIDHDVEENAPSDVAVFLERDFKQPGRILVAVDNNEHARLALRLAQWLQQDGAEEVTALRVVIPGEDAEDARHFVNDLKRSEGVEEKFGTRVIQADSVADGLVQAAKGYDLLILGKPVRHNLTAYVFGAMVDKVAQSAPCSVLLVRHKQVSN